MHLCPVGRQTAWVVSNALRGADDASLLTYLHDSTEAPVRHVFDGPGVCAIVETCGYNVTALTVSVYQNTATVCPGSAVYNGHMSLKHAVQNGLIYGMSSCAHSLRYLQCCLTGAAHTL